MTPNLSRTEEIELARRWKHQGDRAAADALARAHLGMVIAIATRYRGYGLPLTELIAEGNCGIFQALRKFDPERQIRFNTYARHWVRAAILAHVLRSRSVVGRRLGSVQTRDLSLDLPLQSEGTSRWIDTLECSHDTEAIVEREQIASTISAAVRAALARLDRRERYIIQERAMAEPEDEQTLSEMARTLGISRERARQLELRAKRKLRAALASEHDPKLREWLALTFSSAA